MPIKFEPLDQIYAELLKLNLIRILYKFYNDVVVIKQLIAYYKTFCSASGSSSNKNKKKH